MRYVIGLLLSVGMMILLMPKFINYLKSRNINQVTSEYALQEFKEKEKTPIMGGLLFVVIPIIVYAIIYFKGLADRRLLFVLLSYVLYCSVGFIDDCLVISSRSNEGLSPVTRLAMEFGYALILFITATLRELFGSGTLFGYDVIARFVNEAGYDGYQNCGFFTMPAAALIILGCIIWYQRAKNPDLQEK